MVAGVPERGRMPIRWRNALWVEVLAGVEVVFGVWARARSKLTVIVGSLMYGYRVAGFTSAVKRKKLQSGRSIFHGSAKQDFFMILAAEVDTFKIANLEEVGVHLLRDPVHLHLGRRSFDGDVMFKLTEQFFNRCL
jgi:hypothetical protein